MAVAVAGVVVLAAGAMAVLPRLVDTPRVRSLIASSASQTLARPVKFRSVSVSVLPYPVLRLHGFEIAEDPAFGGGPFVRLDQADLRLKLWPLLRGRVEFAALVLAEPVIAMIQGPRGRWNFSSVGMVREPVTASRASRGGGSGGRPPALVSGVVVRNGTVTYERRMPGGLLVRQRLEDLDGTLSPRGGTLAFAGSARVMPGGLAVTVTDGTLGWSGARSLGEAGLRARVEIAGKDVGPIAAAALGPEPAFGGAVRGRLDVGGTLARPRAAGEIELRDPTVTRTSPSCPEPRRRTLTLSTLEARVRWGDSRLLVEPLTSGLDRGRLTTRLAAVPAPPARAELSDLVLQGIPLERMLVDFLCQAYAVTGALDLTGSLALSPGDPLRTLSGQGQFRVGAGTVVGPRALTLLGGLVRPAALASSPLAFDSIAGTYRIADGTVTISDLLYSSRAMKARVRGDYALPSARLTADVVVEHGRGIVQARITGSADAPSIRLTPSIASGVDANRPARTFEDLLKKFR